MTSKGEDNIGNKKLKTQRIEEGSQELRDPSRIFSDQHNVNDAIFTL